MKRGRHDSAYDEVRRQAGYSAPQREFPDEQEEQAIRDRVAKSHAEFKQRMAELDAQEEQRSVELEARLADRSREIGRRMILREYEMQGVKPPVDGILVSLPLLLKLGWQIGEIDRERTLIRPTGNQKKRKTRADYEAERATNGEGS